MTKTKEDEEAYKRVTEERRRCEQRVEDLMSKQPSDEIRSQLNHIQSCLSQPTYYTNQSKMNSLLEKMDEFDK